MLEKKDCGRFAAGCVLMGGLLLFAAPGSRAQGQYQDPDKTDAQATDKQQRYANMPEEAVPYRKFTKPYKEWFITDDTIAYNGAARERTIEEMEKSETVNIGFLGPIYNNPECRTGWQCCTAHNWRWSRQTQKAATSQRERRRPSRTN